MPYIGNTPADKFLTLAKQSFSTSATTSYTLDSSISSTQDIALFINNVRQSPVDAYTVSGTALTLTSATAGTDEMYCVYLGKTVGTVSPPNDSVGLDQLSATGTPSSSNFLRGDNAWASAGLSGWSENSADNDLLPASASAGIYLGVNSATASNLLDDYEFGTFTPSMASTGGSFTTVGTCSGFYTKIGKMVQVQMELSLTTVGSGSGNIDVTNMPFTSAATGLVHTLMMARETQTAGAVYDVIMSRDVTACVILAPAMANGSGYSINGMYRIA